MGFMCGFSSPHIKKFSSLVAHAAIVMQEKFDD